MDAVYVLALFFIVFMIAVYIVIGGVHYFGARKRKAAAASHALRNVSRDALPSTDARRFTN